MLPVIEQGSPGGCVSIVHGPAVPVGSVSTSVTFLAVPGPPLLTWIANSMFSPASTGPVPSFWTVRLGLRQLTWPSSESSGALAEEAVAVLS